ncbi:MAG: hypothetical protein DHS80DRAFT_29165 [Piptocephalis tieghemiana]|nr:MAG: hypothetical protein DHS80DRAFT_29165 [Piptocephalis tieghemiana]
MSFLRSFLLLPLLAFLILSSVSAQSTPPAPQANPEARHSDLVVVPPGGGNGTCSTIKVNGLHLSARVLSNAPLSAILVSNKTTYDILRPVDLANPATRNLPPPYMPLSCFNGSDIRTCDRSNPTGGYLIPQILCILLKNPGPSPVSVNLTYAWIVNPNITENGTDLSKSPTPASTSPPKSIPTPPTTGSLISPASLLEPSVGPALALVFTLAAPAGTPVVAGGRGVATGALIGGYEAQRAGAFRGDPNDPRYSPYRELSREPLAFPPNPSDPAFDRFI